jgi:hypothetical protein
MALMLGPLLYMKIFQIGPCTSDIGQKVAESFWRAHRIGGGTPERVGKTRSRRPAK